MQWPWVSRYRLEEMERRFLAADAERLQLLERLLGAEPVQMGQVRQIPKLVVNPLDEVVTATTGSEPEQYSTPFDRTLSRFADAQKNGSIPAKFRARAR